MQGGYKDMANPTLKYRLFHTHTLFNYYAYFSLSFQLSIYPSTYKNFRYILKNLSKEQNENFSNNNE